MGLLSGPASITRFNVRHLPSAPEFERERFVEIQPGSEVRESVGFVPFELGAPYEVGARRWAFRVRIDRLRPDPTAVAERVRELVRLELESGAETVGPKKRRRLRELAEEELIVRATPSSKIVEACLDGDVLYAASTSKNVLGLVMALLRKIDVRIEVKMPWIDRREPEIESDIVHPKEPGQSVRGCHFLKSLVGDREVLFEPEAGHVRLQTESTRVTVTGAVMGDLMSYLERDAEILSAKLITGETKFQLDALSFSLGSLRVEMGRHEHWTDLLDERLEKIIAIHEFLEHKYDEHRKGR